MVATGFVLGEDEMRARFATADGRCTSRDIHTTRKPPPRLNRVSRFRRGATDQLKGPGSVVQLAASPPFTATGSPRRWPTSRQNKDVLRTLTTWNCQWSLPKCIIEYPFTRHQEPVMKWWTIKAVNKHTEDDTENVWQCLTTSSRDLLAERLRLVSETEDASQSFGGL